MFIEGPLKSGKTSFLADKFIELIQKGSLTSEILVITLNSYKKRVFSEEIRERLQEIKITGMGELPIYTFNGVVYNSIKSQWPVVEGFIPERTGESEIIPNLCGLEISELLIKKAIKEINKKEALEESLRDYQSHKSLKHQILRRHTLISNNNLDKSEIINRAEILDEQMGKQAQEVLEEFKKSSTSFRTFDYLKQITTFLYLLEKDKINFNKIKYLLIDDFDEMTYSSHFFIKKLLMNKHIEEFYIAADPLGSSRRGYLCANYSGYDELKALISSEIINLQCEKSCYEDANKLFQAVINNEPANLSNISLLENSIRHVEMLEQVFARIKVLISNEKISPDNIAIVIPSLDGTLKHIMKEFFENEKINYQFLTGSKKIFDDPLVFGTLIILQLINEEWHFKPKSFEIRTLLTGMLGIPTLFCEEILEKYEETGILESCCHSETQSKNLFNDEDTQLDRSFPLLRMTKLIQLINNLKKEKPCLSKQVEQIFSALILPDFDENKELEDFNNMVKSLLEFEKLSQKMRKINKIKFSEKDWIILMKDTIVSDNPSSAPELKENSVKIATPQKLIDLEIESKIQIWLDISDNSWTKDDIGPLYNAWVFHKNWQGDKYTPEIHKKLTHEKTAHVLRKLVLLSNDKIYCYASQLNPSGAENNGGIENFLSNKNEHVEIKFNFTPRKDQAPVLDYNGGTMAISAVPGAGKTKILEALILKMIQKGGDCRPEDILVLTYMDSAARNIRERIKNSCPELVKFPHISTIHGLALSIIKQDGNHTKLGLDSDFDVCDDSIKFKILNEENDYAGAISQAKFLEIKPKDIEKFLEYKNSDLYKELFDFFPIYTHYQTSLKNRNMVDFDDLLIESVKLLKNNSDIREQYQHKFKYIIEDEAQDSTSVQQELLEILSAKHGNLIRCGDPNQAITSSFSSSNSQNFIDFTEKTKNKIVMDHSQRCAEEIFELANTLIDFAENDKNLKDAFSNQKIKAVAGKNPETKECLNFNIYETPEDEKAKVAQEIEKLRKSGFKFNIGILLRMNISVIKWAEFLESVNIPYICYSEAVAQKKVFRFIKAFLDVLNNPWRNDFIRNLYKELTKAGIIEYQFDSAHFLEKIGSPFICFDNDTLLEFPGSQIRHCELSNAKRSNPKELEWIAASAVSPPPRNDSEKSNLTKFQDEIFKWLDKAILPPEEIISELGSHYFESVIDRSNARIISLLVNRFRRQETDNEKNKIVNLPEVLVYLDNLGRKNRLSGVKFFNEVEKDDDKYEFVQIMTVHKAKGLEFDAVFMPEMQENSYNYSVTPEKIKLKYSDNLINQIKQIKKLHKSVDKIKLEKIHEHLRLIYVGMTRAKHYLYMSGNGKKDWSKTKDYEPSIILKRFISLYERALQ